MAMYEQYCVSEIQFNAHCVSESLSNSSQPILLQTKRSACPSIFSPFLIPPRFGGCSIKLQHYASQNKWEASGSR